MAISSVNPSGAQSYIPQTPAPTAGAPQAQNGAGGTASQADTDADSSTAAAASSASASSAKPAAGTQAPSAASVTVKGASAVTQASAPLGSRAIHYSQAQLQKINADGTVGPFHIRTHQATTVDLDA